MNLLFIILAFSPILIADQNKINDSDVMSYYFNKIDEAENVCTKYNNIEIEKDVTAIYVKKFNMIICSDGVVFHNPHFRLATIMGTPANYFFSNYIGTINLFSNPIKPNFRDSNYGEGMRIDFFLGIPEEDVYMKLVS